MAEVDVNPAVNAGQMPASATNDDANQWCMVEYVSSTVSSGSAVSLSNGTSANVTSISLTAGDWDICGVVDYALTGLTATIFKSAISLTSNTLSTQTGGSGLGTDPLVTVPLLTTILSGTYSQNITPVRLSIASTTTIYLVANCTFSLGSVAAYGTIRARRMR